MKKVLLVLLVLVIGVVAAGHMMSPDYALDRSMVIQAPPEKVHEYVGDLKQWATWGPWMDDDPTIKTTYGPTTTGVGAHQSWTADSGDGNLTFTKSDPQTGVAYDMAFIQGEDRIPVQGWIKYEKVEGGTKVTWGMEGKMTMPMLGGAVDLGPVMLNLFMKRSIGNMFDEGLENLKAKAESKA